MSAGWCDYLGLSTRNLPALPISAGRAARVPLVVHAYALLPSEKQSERLSSRPPAELLRNP